MKRNIVYIIALLTICTACSDFLEEQSQDLTYATSCKDLEELLIGSGYMKQINAKDHYALKVTNETSSAYFPWIHVMDDDTEEYVYGALAGSTTWSRELIGGFHRWEKDPCNVEGEFYEDITWKRLYRHIGVMNVILDKADEFGSDPEEERNRVKGQAYFLRAAYYYLLVNFYAKPYSVASASSDPGVPLKLTSWVEDKNWSRSPVDSVYNQIVSDLKASITALSGIKMKSAYWTNEYAARVLLSRVYCYMGKWELVPSLCDEVLAGDYALVDLNNPGDANTYGLTWFSSPETIFTQGGNTAKALFSKGTGNCNSCFQMSEELFGLFREGDLRPDFIWKPGESRIPQKWRWDVFYTGIEQVSDNFLIRLAEVYLNKAEALAMTGREAEAKETLQQLRMKRIAPASLTEIGYSGKALIGFIREERRRELCFEGQRWFDLRRYAVCSKYPESKEIRHKHYKHTISASSKPGVYQGYYLLRPYPHTGWVLPIPGFEIEQNDGTMVNNEREDCSFFK